MLSLKSLVTLVTGGASGLGLATVNRFVKIGANVVICDLPTSNGNEIAKAFGSNVQFIAADVRSRNDVQNLVKQIEKEYGKLNAVINCAGISNSYMLYNFNKNSARNVEDFDVVIQTNLFGTYNVIRQTAKLISNGEPDEDGQRGVIINTAGVEGLNGGLTQLSNGAASRGIIAMTRPFADDYRKNGIRIVTITVGLFKTPVINTIPVHIQREIGEKFMLAPNYIGDPDQFAYMAQMLVMSPHVNGTNVDMSCGFHLSS